MDVKISKLILQCIFTISKTIHRTKSQIVHRVLIFTCMHYCYLIFLTIFLLYFSNLKLKGFSLFFEKGVVERKRIFLLTNHTVTRQLSIYVIWFTLSYFNARLQLIGPEQENYMLQKIGKYRQHAADFTHKRPYCTVTKGINSFGFPDIFLYEYMLTMMMLFVSISQPIFDHYALALT